MTDWDTVLKYGPDIEEIANRLCHKYDSSVVEDVIQYTRLALKQKVNLSLATGPEREYIRGAIWKIVHEFFRSHFMGEVSLEALQEQGVQIDLSGTVIWPTNDGVRKNAARHFRSQKDSNIDEK